MSTAVSDRYKESSLPEDASSNEVKAPHYPCNSAADPHFVVCQSQVDTDILMLWAAASSSFSDLGRYSESIQSWSALKLGRRSSGQSGVT